MRPGLLPSALMVLFAGCAGGGAPETYEYLLRSEQSPAQRAALETPRIVIGRVSIAPYLDQLGIVLERAPGQVHAARHHLWAEPLDQGLRHYLRQAMSNEMGVDVSIDATGRRAWDYLLDVHFEEFHGSEDGSVRMGVEYTWSTSAAAGTMHRSIFTATESLQGDGYAAMVEAHEALLARLVQAMAADVPE